MFESLEQDGRRSWVAGIVSLLASAVMHALAIILLVFLPLVFFNVLPELDLVTFLIAAPPPPAPIPPPPAPAPAGQSVAASTRQIGRDLDLTPASIPKGIPEPDLGDLDVPDAYPMQSGLTASPYGLPGAAPGPGLSALLGPAVPPSPPQPPPRPARAKAQKVGGVVLDGKVINRIEPEYPPLARTARVSGRVILQVRIDEDGNVEAVEVLSGHPLLVEAAVTAVRQWKYSPTLLNGEPVPVLGTVTVIFSMR